MRRDGAENRRHPVAFVFVILASGLSGGGGLWRADLPGELLGAFVQADQWASRIGRARLDFEHVLHRGDEFRTARGGDHPLLFLPRFEFVFLSV
jgi:hypothetical protein